MLLFVWTIVLVKVAVSFLVCVLVTMAGLVTTVQLQPTSNLSPVHTSATTMATVSKEFANVKMVGRVVIVVSAFVRIAATIMDSARTMACVGVSVAGRGRLVASHTARQTAATSANALCQEPVNAPNLTMGFLARKFVAHTLTDLNAITVGNVRKAGVCARQGGKVRIAPSRIVQLCAAAVDRALFLACANARRRSLGHCARNMSVPMTVPPMANVITARSDATASLDIQVKVVLSQTVQRVVLRPMVPVQFPIGARAQLLKLKWSTS
jgi:hypothetical protein